MDVRPLSLIMVIWALTLLALGSYLSLMGGTGAWIAGQALLVLFFNVAFCLMHEFGHLSFFKSRAANHALGYLCGFACFVPFASWYRIHKLHHRWTGWRDRDPTTRVTTTPPGALTARIINACWKLWIPVFSIAYRVNTYWSFALLKRELAPDEFRSCQINMAMQLAAYAALYFLVGPALLLKVFGVAFFVSLALMDPILLSQHSHIEMPLAAGESVRPMNTDTQVGYTRSIEFPKLVSLLMLVGFDRHEEHHRSPTTPGYELSFRESKLARTYGGFAWIRAAKKIPAATLIFSTEAKTGLKI